jgi:hypothetical protein
VLAFEWDAEAEMVVISGDGEGLRSLARTLERLAARADAGQLDHDHLMSEAWGGHELTEYSGSDNPASPVHHVKIYGAPASRTPQA